MRNSNEEREREIRSEILTKLPGSFKVIKSITLSESETVFEIGNKEAQVAYVILQFLALKTPKQIPPLKKTFKLNNLLIKYGSYIGKVIDIKTVFSSISYTFTTEILVEFRGISLPKMMDAVIANPIDLFQVVYQSALDLGTAHSCGIFQGDVRPKTIHYGKCFLKFDYLITGVIQNYLPLKYESDKIINKAFIPPEVEKVFTRPPVDLDKIDVYYWGISMYQFLMKLNRSELDEELSGVNTSYEANTRVLRRIKMKTIPLFDKVTSDFILRLIRKCLKFYPVARINTLSVLNYLISKQVKDLKMIEPLANKYTPEVFEIAFLNSLKFHQPPIFKSMNFLEIFFSPVSDQIDKVLSNPDITSNNSLYDSVVNSNKQIFLKKGINMI